MSIIDSIQLSGVTYQIQGSGGGGNPTVELTQAEYDALVTAGTVSADTYYIITDAQAGDLTNYYTKSETNTLLGDKADTATTYTKTEVDNAITAGTSTKQDTLVSGTNIKTINNTSILGSGNIDIQGGGGSSYTAGDGIDITNDVISVTGKADTSAVTAIQDSLSGYVKTNTEQIISGRKIFTYSSSSGKAIEFKQTNPTNKVGFRVINSASINNELASFEFRPNTFTIDNVKYPLMYFGHYRSTNIADAGVPQTVIGFRQYDGKNNAAYHYLMPLPEKAKTPFSLTTSFKDYYAPMGFKNGSTMITADNTGVVDLSSEFIGKADAATTYTKSQVDTALNGKVDTSAITTTITSSSTDAQVPSAKAVYDIVGNIETLLSQI